MHHERRGSVRSKRGIDGCGCPEGHSCCATEQDDVQLPPLAQIRPLLRALAIDYQLSAPALRSAATLEAGHRRPFTSQFGPRSCMERRTIRNADA
jgi:hypothetical protein